MPNGYAWRVRQSGWFSIALALLVISVILFIWGAGWQEEEIEAVPILNDDGEYVILDEVPKSNRPAFKLFGAISLTLSVISILIAVLSPWYHHSLSRLRSGMNAIAFFRFLLCLFLIAIMLFPAYWMIVTSFLTGDELLREIPVFSPSNLSFENYSHVIQNTSFRQYALNTLLSACFILLGQITIGTLAAYGFSKGRFKGKNQLFGLVLGAIVIPAQALYVPLYTMAWSWNWVNTYTGLVLPNLISGVFIFLLRQAFLSVDDSYLEAAKLDGMGRIRNITHVLIPLCEPTFSAACVFTLIREWNSYIWPKIITTGEFAASEKKLTIALGIQSLLRASDTGTMNYNEVMAAAVLAVLPILLLLVVFNRHLTVDVEGPPIR